MHPASSKRSNQGVVFPDVCLTPLEAPANPPGVPIPYTNAIDGMAKNGNKKAQKEQAEMISYAKAQGYEHVNSATQFGLVSKMMKERARFASSQAAVKVEGSNVFLNTMQKTQSLSWRGD